MFDVTYNLDEGIFLEKINNSDINSISDIYEKFNTFNLNNQKTVYLYFSNKTKIVISIKDLLNQDKELQEFYNYKIFEKLL